MGDLVRVESVEALKRFRAAFCKFAEIATTGLDEAEFEVQRTSFWVKQDRQAYWKRQVSHRTELLTRARLALKQKESQRTPLGGRYSCVDEMKAVAAAQRALDEACQKQANVQRWSRVLDEERFSFQAQTQTLRVALQADIPNALAQLDQMIAALEGYASAAIPQQQTSTAPQMPEETSAATDLPSMARTPPAPPAPGAAQYELLHARTPSQAIRDATPVTAPGPHEVVANAASSDSAAVLSACGLPQTPCDADAKIVLARGVLQSRHTYLERIDGAAQDDSGWFVGFADDSQAAAYDALRVADLLALRPDWAAVLALPPGCLVTCDGRELQAVYGPHGNLLWSAR
jgi:hypothetical protein